MAAQVDCTSTPSAHVNRPVQTQAGTGPTALSGGAAPILAGPSSQPNQRGTGKSVGWAESTGQSVTDAAPATSSAALPAPRSVAAASGASIAVFGRGRLELAARWPILAARRTFSEPVILSFVCDPGRSLRWQAGIRLGGRASLAAFALLQRIFPGSVEIRTFLVHVRHSWCGGPSGPRDGP